MTVLARIRRRAGARLLMLLMAVGLTTLVLPMSGASASFAPLGGSGSSWAYPAIDKWTTDIKASKGISISFQPTGSAAGRQAFILNQADFAASDIAFLTSPDPFGGGTETEAYDYSYIPIVAGGTSFLYNLKVGTRKVTDLRLSGATLTGIFTGQITNWDDPRIAHDYGSTLPSQHITVVTRADGSGASYEWSEYEANQYPAQWKAFCAKSGFKPTAAVPTCTPTEFYPGITGGVQKNGSDQVAAFIASPQVGQGSIGYDEYAYALLSHIPVVAMLNAGGYYVPPTAYNVAIALQAAVINNNPKDANYLTEDLRQVYVNKDPRTYPMSSYSYLIVPRLTNPSNPAVQNPPPRFNQAQTSDALSRGASLSTWLNYVLCGAQQNAASLGYSPLPKNLVVGGFTQDKNIPGAVPTPDLAQLNGCNNPTYSNGVNLLLKNAPFPSVCEKEVRPASCNAQNIAAGGTGAAVTRGANDSARAASAVPGATAATGGTAAKAGSTGVVDPDTGLAAATTGDVGTAAAAFPTPVPLGKRNSGDLAYAILTTLVIIAAVAVPIVVGTALSSRARTRGGP